MKDFLNQEINIGDRVVTIDYIKTSSWFVKAKVVGFTEQMVKIEKEGEEGYGPYPNAPYFLKMPDKIVVIK